MIGNIDVYMDKSWIQYDKIYGTDVFGSCFYTSLYAELFEVGIEHPGLVAQTGQRGVVSHGSHGVSFLVNQWNQHELHCFGGVTECLHAG